MSQEGLFAGRIEPVQLEDEIQRSYLDYAMSVIVARALPDVRDGLKPVQRRILWSMLESGLRPDRPYRKSVATVGEVLKKYHPHGDQSVYDALVRMAQPWNLRAPLVQGQGNFGSPEGDPAAAYRYTEARLSPLAMEILRDIDAETVDFDPNFDGHEVQPAVLPARFPNLLVNGAGGIAVGMATNIPPHNLGEVIDGTIACLERPEVTVAELMKHVKGPDFPTGATILGKEGRVRDIAGDTATRQAIRNESRADLRLVIELRPGANPHVVLNQLYKHTQLQETFGVIMLTIVEGVPRVLSLKDVVMHYVEHQVDVVTRRTRFLLRKAEERDHIVLGLLIALDHLDEVIKIIRGSQHADEARTKLMKRFKLSEVQANHILDMPLRRLTRLARAELEQEHTELLERIEYFRTLLGDPARIRGVIKDELLDIKKRFADPRRTQIKADEGELDMEDLIAEEDVVVTVSRAGY